MKYILLLVALLVSSAVFTEAKSKPSPWKVDRRAQPTVTLPLLFALKQQNLDVIEEAILDVSNPYSKNYGKWWTQEQILKTISPAKSEVAPVITYLEESGFSDVVNTGDYIEARATVSVIEAVFKTELFVLRHPDGRQIIRSLGQHTVPSDITYIVELVEGISELPVVQNIKTRPVGKNNRQRAIHSDITVDPGVIVPSVLQNVYKFPTSFPVHENSSICLAEFQGDSSFSKTDLKSFAKQNAMNPFDVTNIVGPYNPSSPDPESTLDVQYGGAVALNSSIWFWTVPGWMLQFANGLFNTKTAPFIVSMSWGWPENWQCQIAKPCTNSEGYVSRTNTEFMKIGLRGITLLAASGDQGAPGDGNPSCDVPKAPISTIFPGASPWVTSVGATMLVDSSKSTPLADEPPVCKNYQCSTSTTESVCTYPSALITTGGGFSDYSPMPSWQSDAVHAYLKSGATFPPSQFFNASNRAFPDVAALGHNYIIFISGSWLQVDGTSCSSPVFAGTIALLNSARFNKGKSSLGFVNPVLYAAAASNPNVYHDITTGDNKCTEECCSKYGYEAAKGWDATTGLGTPNFPELLAYIETLK